jgi:PAS domain S-box-containing protein
VLWGAAPDGVVAAELAHDSPAKAAGIRSGDVLLAIDGHQVRVPRDVVGILHRAPADVGLTYSILRDGAPVSADVVLVSAAPLRAIYFALAAVGAFMLLVGASVRLRRPRDQATLHFFWLCVAFYGTFTFSFAGPFGRLDWVFYWADSLARAMLPPLLLHFTLVFPERPARLRRLVVGALYLPSFVIIAGRIFAVASASIAGPQLSRTLEVIDRLDEVYLILCVAASLAVLARAFGEITAVTGRRQLRWLAWGTVVGGGPFVFGYALPWAFGIDPPAGLQLTAVPLGLVPLTFASAIVRYRLRDVEVIVKRTLSYAAFLGASAALCLAMLRLVGFAFADEADPHNWVVAVLATIVVVLIAQPVKNAVQNALDRVFYRDRYDYRRALVGFARDLNADLDVVRLSQRLGARIVETLVVDRMAVMLADERLGDFHPIGGIGPEPIPDLQRSSSFVVRLDAGHTVALDDPITAARFVAEEVEFWRDHGIYYFVPCVFEGSAIAVLALGRKDGDVPFNSEDLALLTAVAGQVATAIENGRLYRQLQVKAGELGRMREFNDNILESLDDGLVVLDGDERIVRWNLALERFYGLTRGEVIGKSLDEVFDRPFLEALRAARLERPEAATLFRVPLHVRVAQGVGNSRSDPLRRLVNATAVPLKNPSAPGVVDGTILLIADATERVRLEEQLQISEKMASIGLLAAGVAHEVNTPLTGISSFTQMLLEGADPSDPKTPLLQKIERQSFRAAKIVNGLLALSRPGKPEGERAEVDLNTVVSDVLSLLEHQLEVGSIRVRRDLSQSPLVVAGIEHQLQQVFLNLFLNARDAMPKGGWLTVSTRNGGAQGVAEVADTGSGIPPEHLARIYDPFFTTKALGRGTGLGLSITYSIVHEHDGSIRCDSTVGQGTRFTLAFPLGAAAAVRRAART